MVNIHNVSIWWLRQHNIEEVARCIKQKPESVCQRDSPFALATLIFNESKAIESVQRIHRQLNISPADESAISQRIAWQKCTRSNTGSYDKPGPQVHDMKNFKRCGHPRVILHMSDEFQKPS